MSIAQRRVTASPPSPAPLRLVAPPPGRCEAFEAQPASASRRARIEAFIQAIYQRRYQAHIAHWMPSLVALAWDERLVAAAGYRCATERLFLECYLPAPVERMIATRCGAEPSRESIFEVGHFASAQNGAGRALMIPLGRHLAAQGCRWVVSTATAGLRALFTRLGVRFVELEPAHAAVLGEEASAWGSYYDHAPIVIACELAPSLAIAGACA